MCTASRRAGGSLSDLGRRQHAWAMAGLAELRVHKVASSREMVQLLLGPGALEPEQLRCECFSMHCACLLLLLLTQRQTASAACRPFRESEQQQQHAAQQLAQLVCELGPSLSGSTVVQLEPLLGCLLGRVAPSARGSESLLWLLAANASCSNVDDALLGTPRVHCQLHGTSVPPAFAQLWEAARCVWPRQQQQACRKPPCSCSSCAVLFAG